jgi:hypothetical protein
MDLNRISHANHMWMKKGEQEKEGIGIGSVAVWAKHGGQVKIPLGISFSFSVDNCCLLPFNSFFFAKIGPKKTLNKIIQGAKIQNGFNF